MAYTYDDFVTAANNAGMMGNFSDDDLRIAAAQPEYGLSMLKLQQDAQNATTAEQKLLVQETMNQIRSSYGGQTPATSANSNAYQKALDNVLNQGSFTYDPATDPQFGALKKTYLREGERAMEDTMATASAASGGMPSTYAITAAQQANDYYNTKFTDLIPTLQQNAYSRYLSDFDMKLQQLGALQQDQERKLQAAELMASKGDYSLLADYYGLTPEQLALLQAERNGGYGGTKHSLPLPLLAGLYQGLKKTTV